MSVLSSPATISEPTATFPFDRISCPTRAKLEDYQERNQPVLVTDVSPQWGAMQKWDAEYLKSVAGGSTVTVHYDADGDFRKWYTSPLRERVDQQMPFGKFIELVAGQGEGRNYYMTEHSLREISRSLARDVDLTSLVDLSGTPWEPLLFVGRDTCMPLHYHGTTEAVLCQLIGTKKVTLMAPDQTRFLYASPWHAQSPLFSRIDGREIQGGNVDLDKWPLFKRARLIQFTLHPGEILFIPVHWWHVTSVPEFQVSMTCFWKSKLRRWTFPSPGIAVGLRELLHKVRKRRRARTPAEGGYGY